MILGLLACVVDLGERSAAANADCGSCHEQHQADFDHSRHARAAESELFVALRAQAAESLGSEEGCDTCHAPEEGFTCLTCHAAYGNRGTSQGRLLWDPDGPVAGRHDADAPHATEGSGFLVDSALCGTCHDVDAPTGFDEHPYRAWLDSPAAARGESCQSCHQPPADYGSSHRFQGIADGGEAARALLLSGLDIHRDGDVVTFVNLAGHNYPDGAAQVRELWIGDLPLHPELLRNGQTVVSPVEADTRVDRAIAPGGELVLTSAEEVCITYRSVNAALSASLGLPERRLETLGCF